MKRAFHVQTSKKTAIFCILTGLLTGACDGGGSEKGKNKDKDAAADEALDGSQPGDGDGDKPAGDGDGDGDKPAGDAGGDGDAPAPDAGPVCDADCDDKIDCTADTCIADGVCTHVLTPSLCEAGSSCHPEKGCVKGDACSKPQDCEDDDGCTTMERCGAELAMCEFNPLDGDNDGAAPSVCGGGDCDDANDDVGPGETERCNGVDDNCNKQVDEQAECGGEGQVCKDAACVCAEGLTECSGRGRPTGCFDFKSDPRHCGDCNTDCGPAGVCNAGTCECPAPAELCNDSCVDTQSSQLNCGECGTVCDFNPLEACVKGKCSACGAAGEACCPVQTPIGPIGTGCDGALTCSGTPGSAGATCGCTSPSKMCGDTCVNPTTSEAHCGKCDNACENGENCLDTGAGPACTPCGGAGEACCDVGGLRYCGNAPGGGGPHCNQDTLICEN